MSDFATNLDESIFSNSNIAQNILPYYDLGYADVNMVKFKDTEKQRAVYKVDGKHDSYCLKKVYFSEDELLYVYSALEWLHRHNINVPNLLPTVNKGRFVRYDGMLFILTPWINGVKCDFDNLNHVISSAVKLAEMHKSSFDFTPIKGSANRIGFDNIYVSTAKHFEQLLQTSNLAFQYKDKFSREFLEKFDKNLELAKLSLEVSSLIDEKELSRSLCHGDYVNKNIIFEEDNSIWIIDFDKCKYDYCAHDLSYFLRRLLKRDNTKWDLELATSIIKAYNSHNHLSPSDLKYIVSYICFPQKYWKISRDYYKNIKKCNKNSFFALLLKSSSKIDHHLEFTMSIINKMQEADWNADKLI